MPSIYRPRNYKNGKPHRTYSHAEELRAKSREMKFERYVDTIPDIDEELMIDFNRQLRMLERGTGFIRKCIYCERIVIISKMIFYKMWDERRRYYYCSYCLIDKKLEGNRYNKKMKEKPDWYDKGKRKNDKLQPMYKKVWDDYYKQLHRGVTISKLSTG